MTAISQDRVIGVHYNPISEEDIFEEEKHKKQHTLEEFAIDHIRPPRKSSISRRQGIFTKDLWSHTRVPIKLPLLKSLQKDPELVDKSCSIFKAILKYSGEYPTQKNNEECAFTDGIFQPALNDPRLRDEVYCQIIKQLTGNKGNNDICAWEMMWLVTGSFACTDFLMAEVDKFLRTARRRWLAKYCLERLRKTLGKGSRLYAPNIVEVETIKFKMTKIFNTVFYPNDTEGHYEVDSSNTVQDFVDHIIGCLEMKPTDDFKLFVKIENTIVSMPGNMFFYDYMRHDHLAQQSHPVMTETEPDAIYKSVVLIFMRKTWSDMVPGKDPVADSIFHYPQEMPKLLRGWHKCSKEDATRLAALICRVKIAEDKRKKVLLTDSNMPKLDELLPADLKGSMLEDEWKKDILEAYTKHKDKEKSAVQAKTEFLKIVFQWPTFGSAFVDVKQTCLPNLSNHLRVCVNKNGILLIESKTKNTVMSYSHSQIMKCTGDETHFSLTVKEATKKMKLRFETDLGYKVADLVNSYIENTSAPEGAEP